MSLFSFWEMLSPGFQASSLFLPLLHLSTNEFGWFPQAFCNIPSATPPRLSATLLKLNVHMTPLGILFKGRFYLVGLEWGLRFCISNKLPWKAEAAGPVQRHSEKQDLREQCLPPASNIHPTAPKVTSPNEMLVGCHLRATKLKIQWRLPFWMITILN